MKQIIKSTLAVIALATISNQAVLAQSVATSKVNSRERILQVLDQSRPNDYVPVFFNVHFPDKFGYGAVKSHIDWFRARS